jgi:prolyl oligopeptidase
MKPDLPVARVNPETTTIGGITYDDPYQWLETPTDETLAWQTAQDERAREYIRAWPGWQKLRDAVERATEAAQGFVFPTYHDGLWISGRDLSGASRILPGKALATVQVLDGPGGQPVETLLDLNELPHIRPIQLGGFALSPDKTLMSYSILEGGGEKPLIRIVNRSTGEVVLDGLPVVYAPPLVLGGVPTWLPNSDTLFYVALHVQPGSVPALKLFRFHLGDLTPHRAEPLEINDPVVMLRFTHDKRYLMVMGGLVHQRPYYVLDTTDPDGPFVPFLKDVPGKFKGDIVGDEYICVTDDGAPRGRVIAVPMQTPADRSRWRELLPASDALVNDIVVVGDRLVLCEVVDAASRLRMMRLDGTIEGEIPLPGPGLVSTAPGTALQLFTAIDTVARGEPGEIIFGFAAFDQSPSLYRCDVAARTIECLLAPAARIKNLTVTRVWATSNDGTRVPADVIHRSGLDLSRPRPMLVHAYGGFNMALMPAYVGELEPFLDAGGMYVTPHLRGGGEYGTDWWTQGRMTAKQNVFDDLYAVCEQLIAAGVTRPDLLAFQGSSNGGLVAAVAATQRPDLFRVIVARVPLLDLLRAGRFALVMEFGDPQNPADATVLAAYSPYHNVREASYPAVLLDAGENDPRCPAWHARKMAARLQSANRSGHPVLLRVWKDAGHVGSSKPMHVEQSADWLAFVMGELGIASAGT